MTNADAVVALPSLAGDELSTDDICGDLGALTSLATAVPIRVFCIVRGATLYYVALLCRQGLSRRPTTALVRRRVRAASHLNHHHAPPFEEGVSRQPAVSKVQTA